MGGPAFFSLSVFPTPRFCPTITTMNTNALLKLAFMRGVEKADAEAGISLQDHMKALEKHAAWWTMPVLGALGGGALGAMAGGPDAFRNAMWGAVAGGLGGGALKGALAWRGAAAARKATQQALAQAGKQVPSRWENLALAGAGGLGAGYLLNQYLNPSQTQGVPMGMPMGMPMGLTPVDPNMQQSIAGTPPGYDMSYPGGYR